MAVTALIFPSASPGLFSCIICLAADPKCSGFSNPFFSAVVKMPTPNGLVRNKISPQETVLRAVLLAKAPRQVRRQEALFQEQFREVFFQEAQKEIILSIQPKKELRQAQAAV